MALDEYWRNLKSYSILELAFIASGEEPEQIASLHALPKKADNAFNKMKLIIDAEGNEIFEKIYKYDINYSDLIDYYKSTVNRDWAIKLIDSIGVPNFLTAPSNKELQQDQPNLNDIKPISITEREKLFKIIGILSISLADKVQNLKKNDGQPNINQISEYINKELALLGAENTKGLSNTNLRTIITQGINLLETDKIKTVSDTPNS